MHIEPAVVEGAKIALSYASGTAALGYAAKLALQAMKTDGALALLVRTLIAAVAVFISFEVLPHTPVGVSEVHLILGTTLLLMLGVAPAANGWWHGVARLPAGVHLYRFWVVDAAHPQGYWLRDPENQNTAESGYTDAHSLIHLS